MLQAMREGAHSKLIKFVLFGLLIMGVAGLVLMDVGGSFRSGMFSNNVAKIGKSGESIGIREFDYMVRDKFTDLSMAYQMGLVTRELQNEIARRLLRTKAYDMGFRVSEQETAKFVAERINRSKPEDMSVQQAFDTILLQNNMSEKAYFNLTRSIISQGLLEGLLASGSFTVPEILAKDKYAYDNATVGIDYVEFAFKDTKNINKPTEEELEEFYQKTKENYAVPEKRNVSLVIIDRDTVGANSKADEYDDTILDMIEDKTEAADDFIAGGGELEEMAKELKLEILKITDLEIADQESTILPEKIDLSLLNAIKSEAFSMLENEISPALSTDNNAYIIVRTDSITEKTYKPLKDVIDKVSSEWRKRQINIKTAELASKAASKLRSGEVSLQELAKEKSKKIKSKELKRNNETISDQSRSLDSIASVFFDSNIGEVINTRTDDGYVVAVIRDFSLPSDKEMSSEKAKKKIEEIKLRLSYTINGENIGSYLDKLFVDYNVTINDNMLERAYGSNEGSFY